MLSRNVNLTEGPLISTVFRFTVSWMMNLTIFTVMTLIISQRYRHGHLRRV